MFDAYDGDTRLFRWVGSLTSVSLVGGTQRRHVILFRCCKAHLLVWLTLELGRAFPMGVFALYQSPEEACFDAQQDLLKYIPSFDFTWTCYYKVRHTLILLTNVPHRAICIVLTRLLLALRSCFFNLGDIKVENGTSLLFMRSLILYNSKHTWEHLFLVKRATGIRY